MYRKKGSLVKTKGLSIQNIEYQGDESNARNNYLQWQSVNLDVNINDLKVIPLPDKVIYFIRQLRSRRKRHKNIPRAKLTIMIRFSVWGTHYF